MKRPCTVAPGLMRRFSFESMPVVSARATEEVRESFEARIRNDVEVDIRASDIDPDALKPRGAMRTRRESRIGSFSRRKRPKT